MTWDGHRQVGIGQIGVGTVTVVTLSEHTAFITRLVTRCTVPNPMPAQRATFITVAPFP